MYENNNFLEYLKSCKENSDKLKDKQRKIQEFLKTIQIDKETGNYLVVKSEIEEDERERINIMDCQE